MDADDNINKLRCDIDHLDDQILKLINERLTLATEIGKIKLLNSRQIFDTARESMILQRLSNLNKGPLKKNALNIVFKEIIAAAREIQTNLQISYLGPQATFTHIAAIRHFGRSSSFIPQSTIKDVFEAVEKGDSHYGVVPVENSIEGSVNHTLDLLFESELKICAEKYLSISHDLLLKDGLISDIKVIYSHPHVFPQCRKWLQVNIPDAELKECSSTAYAAKIASETPNTAAIASSEAANIYNLKIIAAKIEDSSRNTTRFLIIGRDEIHRTGFDKTSFMFVTAHVPGALFNVLEPIAKSNINMMKLESRPTKYENWSYFFIIDVEGHIEDTNVKETIEEMRSRCLYLKWLGSYHTNKEY